MPTSPTTTVSEAILLVGGFATRLKGVIGTTPKALAPVAGVPMLDRLVLGLYAQGLRRFVLCTGHEAQQITDHAAGYSLPGAEFIESRERQPLGTGGAVRNAISVITSELALVLNGDSSSEFDLAALEAAHRGKAAAASILLTEVPDCSRYGSVLLAPSGAITAFREKAAAHGSGLINAGVYLMSRSLISEIPAEGAVSLETFTFPSLIGRGLFGWNGASKFIDIGTPESLVKAQTHFREPAGVSL